jgi:type IV pilus assembly protein PilC
MRLHFVASTKDGKIEKGEIEAANRENAVDLLRGKGLLIIALHEKKKIHFHASKILDRFGFVSNLEKVVFTKHLSLMLKAGLTLNESLSTLKEQTNSSQMKKIIESLVKKVEDGKSLASGLSEYPQIFSNFYIHSVGAGEQSGDLEENLIHLADQMTKDFDLRRKVKSAMMYPLVVLGATVILGVSLSVVVFPKLARLFKTFKIELPFLTRILLATTDFLQKYALFAAVIIIFLFFVLRWVLRRGPIRPYFHRFILRIPIFGKIAKNLNLARFARTFGSLLRSGLPIGEAIQTTSDALGNYAYKINLAKISREVGQGEKLSKSLAVFPEIFPPMVCQMIAVGERSGKLEEVLFYLAEFYEAEVDATTKNLSTILEPVLLVLIGVVVAGVALAVVTPLYQLTSGMKIR